MKPRELLEQFARPTPIPMVIGHRGYSSRAPENTLAAFRLVLEHGIQGVELDVHRCATGEIVVAHDETLQRTAGVPVKLREAPYGQIREHDVGRWFGEEFAGERVPLLEEVLELLGGRVFVDIEIKHYATQLGRAHEGSVEAETVRLIRRHGLGGRSIVSSFDPFVVRRVRLLAPEVPVAAIYADTPDLPRFVRRGGARFYSGATVMKPNHARLPLVMSGSTTAAADSSCRGRSTIRQSPSSSRSAEWTRIITNRPVEIREALRQTSR